LEQEKTPKPFKAYNIFGRLKRSANYSYIYKKEYKKAMKTLKKLEKKKGQS
jgi:hypothetical protein